MAKIGSFLDYETSCLFYYQDGKIYRKSDDMEIWPDAVDCICLPQIAEYDPQGGQIFVQFKPNENCTVHS